MAGGALEAERLIELFDLEAELRFDCGGGGRGDGGVGAGERDHVAADAVLHGGWFVAGDEAALVEDGQARAAVGFVHQVGGEKDRGFAGTLDVDENFPEINAGGGVEAGGGFIQK